jgi:glycosyltransferase involved in cell wall biosynthesis
MIRYRRDRWIYEWGLRHVDAILAQTAYQQDLLRKHYGIESGVARMPVTGATRTLPFDARDVGVLWVNNFRPFKRPDRYVELARALPGLELHMVGGAVERFQAYHAEIAPSLAATPNLRYHGAVPYHAVNDYYERARVFVNTSDTEGFPNSFLQAWARGTPVVSYFDPDGLIAREGLGVAARSAGEMRESVASLAADAGRWAEVSARCLAYMRRAYNADEVLAPYAATFERLSADVQRHRT